MDSPSTGSAKARAGVATADGRSAVVVRPARRRHAACAGADLAALPALARILENTPGHIAVTVLAKCLMPRIFHTFRTETTPPSSNWSVRNDAAESRLSAALAELDPKPDAYVWYSAESADIRAIKDLCSDSAETGTTSSATGGGIPSGGSRASMRGPTSS